MQDLLKPHMTLEDLGETMAEDAFREWKPRVARFKELIGVDGEGGVLKHRFEVESATLFALPYFLAVEERGVFRDERNLWRFKGRFDRRAEQLLRAQGWGPKDVELWQATRSTRLKTYRGMFAAAQTDAAEDTMAAIGDLYVEEALAGATLNETERCGDQAAMWVGSRKVEIGDDVAAVKLS